MSNKSAIPPDGTSDMTHDRLRLALTHGGDDTNPALLFATTHTALLQAIEVGLVDSAHLVHCELVRRGLGAPAADSAEPEPDTTADQAVAEIARKILHLETIETRNSDALDFPDGISVWQIKEALLAAFGAGQAAAR